MYFHNGLDPEKFVRLKMHYYILKKNIEAVYDLETKKSDTIKKKYGIKQKWNSQVFYAEYFCKSWTLRNLLGRARFTAANVGKPGPPRNSVYKQLSCSLKVFFVTTLHGETWLVC